MNLLLDTHAFIWWASAPDMLSPHARALCQNHDHQLYLSVASLWEIQIKANLGKLNLFQPLKETVELQQEANGLIVLSISPQHTYALNELPAIHKDPFDRMLIAQARCDRLRLVSHDTLVKSYPVESEW